VIQTQEVSTYCLKNCADRLARRRVATNLQFVKNAISAKSNKTRYACNLQTSFTREDANEAPLPVKNFFGTPKCVMISTMDSPAVIFVSCVGMGIVSQKLVK
jgi:hypothetical protein